MATSRGPEVQLWRREPLEAGTIRPNRPDGRRVEPAAVAEERDARLGFNATEGLFAVVTTIAGAAMGANLTLALDIAWDRQVRDRFAATSAKDSLEARPSIG